MTPEEFNRAMGAAIDALRKSRGMTHKAMGDALGVTYQQIQKCLKGRNQLSAYRVCQFAEMLEVTVAYLFEQAGAQTNAEPSPAANDGFLAARYVSRIQDDQLRSNVVDFTRKLAYQSEEAA